MNLAVSLANRCKLKVGLLDADVYGPSIPIMMKLEGKPQVTPGVPPWITCVMHSFFAWLCCNVSEILFLFALLTEKKMIPIENYGVRCMSMGSLVEEGAALVWRGPMVAGICIALLDSIFISPSLLAVFLS